MNKRINLSSIISFIFLFYGTLAIIYSLYNLRYEWLFWFCYMGMILIGIGGLRKNIFLIVSQINILLIPLVFWNLDFIINIFSGKNYFGIVDYFFEEMTIFSRMISLEHFFLIPLSFFLIYLILKIKQSNLEKIKLSWIISLIQISLVFLVMHLLKATNENINCIKENCYSFVPILINYYLQWFLFYVALIIISNSIICFLLSKFINKKKIK